MRFYYIFTLILLPFLSGCWSKNDHIVLNGYTEGEFRLLSSIDTGIVTDIKVKKGDIVQKDQILAAIENTDRALSLNKAQSAYDLAKITLDRLSTLQKKGAASKADLDSAKATFDQAKSDLELAKWYLDKENVKAPEEGYIQNILKHPGEMATPQTPIIYFLPKTGIKIRFFVPESLLSRIKLNNRIKVHVDGLTQPLFAKIQFISNVAEFNPPVIYSNALKTKLLFMVEAVPEIPLSIKPGQPVEIFIGNKHE